MERRAYDIAGITKLNINFNGNKIVLGGMVNYCKMFLMDEEVIYDDLDDLFPRWRVIIGKTTKGFDQMGFQQMSFVNDCIWTRKGGAHVDQVITKVVNSALLGFKKRSLQDTDILMKKELLCRNWFVFVWHYAHKPVFD